MTKRNHGTAALSLLINIALAGAWASTAAAQSAGPQAASNGTGLVLGARAGFGVAFGKTNDDGPDTDMSNGVNGAIPLWLDVGYRVLPNLQIGAFFQYAFALLNEDKAFSGCKTGGVSCSGSDLVIGADVQYHLLLDAVDPWFGVGVGYERLGFTMSGGGDEVTIATSGINFLNLQAGADFKVATAFALGPFISFSAGQYSSSSVDAPAGAMLSLRDPEKKAMHEWLIIGARGVFNL